MPFSARVCMPVCMEGVSLVGEEFSFLKMVGGQERLSAIWNSSRAFTSPERKSLNFFFKRVGGWKGLFSSVSLGKKLSVNSLKVLLLILRSSE